MSKFVCGLSGEPVEEAVVSQVSGVVYEKRLIHKWIQVNSKIFQLFPKWTFIQENGTDPVNDQQLDTDQLVELKADCLVKLGVNFRIFSLKRW